MDQNATLPTLPEAAVCTICLDPVAAPEGARSVASLRNSELEPISCRSNSEPMPFYHHTAGGEGDPTADLSNNVGTGIGTEPRNSGMEQCFLDILPMVDLANRTTNPFGFEVPRNDGSNQRRSTPYALSLPNP
ncbi:hypothetical protein BAE44_0000871 [Dichanthelium oligosanthes]|uniref:Uncharacterized protein n=1 Tax=Dichanthelium oligosanthes TaxID=888268 RepID=A0A1E5WLU7_9POAL|nr:hypothetical protein BAE44_0000871 [Dichanthelium oligosanthes]